MKRDVNWPWPGDKHWRKGCALVTTQDCDLGDTYPFVKELL